MQHATLRAGLRNAAVLALALLPMGMVWSADAAGPAAAQAAPSKELREKMASLHDQMAACLRSEKSVAECRTQMMQGCRDIGSQACPMMGRGSGMGMARGREAAPPAGGTTGK